MLISRGCPWASMKRGGCKDGDGKTGAVLCPKRGGCSFAVGTQAQRVSAPPPGMRPHYWPQHRMRHTLHIYYEGIYPLLHAYTQIHTDTQIDTCIYVSQEGTAYLTLSVSVSACVPINESVYFATKTAIDVGTT